MTANADPDRELVERAQTGDYDAFSALVDRHADRAYRLGRRILKQDSDAQDVVQQTFLSVIEKIDRFRGESKFSTWLTRIATNHALKTLRKRRRVSTLSFQTEDPEESYADLPHPDFIAQWSENPEALAGRNETQRLLAEAIDGLDEKYRLVFLLRDVEGLSVRETAETLDLSESNVKVRLLRARLMLRERLTREFGDESTRMFPGHDHDG